ncbi:MAG: GMC family oxidoreductase [Polyangia bacterium]
MQASRAIVDVVVVGTGAGAAALVGRLCKRGLSVCMVERGVDEPPASAPSELQAGRGFAPPSALTNTLLGSDGKPSAPFALEGSALGGGTVVYTGNVLRFQPGDFHRRRTLGDVAGAQVADWPLTYEELAPYYDEMEDEMGVAGDAAANPFEPPRRGPYPAPALALDRSGHACAEGARKLGWHPFPMPSVANPARGRAACVRCGLCTAFLCTVDARWSARPQLLAAATAGTLSLVLGATVTRVLMQGGRATGVEYATKDGALHAIHARTVVLAANAVQTPRLLLQSATSHHRDGLANGSGQVGRNMMTHVMENFMTIGHIDGEPTISAAGCTLGIQDFYDPVRSGAPLPITFEPRTMGAYAPFSRFVTGDPSWAALDEATLRDRFSRNVVMLTMMEDLPRAENRVRLHETLRDALGLPVPVVAHTPHELDIATSLVGAARARELLAVIGARDVVSVSPRTARFHIMGTCRMGDDPATSVVDRDGRTHEVANLWIADASVFVSSAGVNPSLTVQALARRTADRMLARGPG